MAIRKKIYETYTNANCEDGDEVFGLGVVFVRHEVVLNQQNFFGDVWVSDGLEDGHTDPEPDVECGKGAAQVSAKLEALLPSCHSHCKNEFLLIIAQIINYGNKQQINWPNRFLAINQNINN